MEQRRAWLSSGSGLAASWPGPASGIGEPAAGKDRRQVVAPFQAGGGSLASHSPGIHPDPHSGLHSPWVTARLLLGSSFSPLLEKSSPWPRQLVSGARPRSAAAGTCGHHGGQPRAVLCGLQPGCSMAGSQEQGPSCPQIPLCHVQRERQRTLVTRNRGPGALALIRWEMPRTLLPQLLPAWAQRPARAPGACVTRPGPPCSSALCSPK